MNFNQGKIKKYIRVIVTALILCVAATLVAGCSLNDDKKKADAETEKKVETVKTSEEKVETEPEPEPEPVAPVETAPFYIAVNCQTNTVNVYQQDSNGEYTIPCRVMVCSSGLDSTPTPTGEYYLTGNRWEWLSLVGDVSGMYVTQIVGDYLFHSVPYTEKWNHASLQPGEFDKLGEDASHGCIRLQVEDAKWIYDNMWNIEAVQIYNSPDPGPLGKPSAPKIGNSSYPEWDPSDMHPDNPWNR